MATGDRLWAGYFAGDFFDATNFIE